MKRIKKISTLIKRPCPAAICGCLLLAGVADARAQFSLEGSSLATGGGEELLSQSGQLSPNLPEGQFLRFRLSFGTDELAAAGGFKDSWSVGLFNEGEALDALLLTTDIFGLHLAPENPGGLPLDSGFLQVTGAEHPVQTSGFNTTFSFQIQAQLPNEFTGKALDMRVDLFDNLNSAQSVGYIDQITVVPEPGGLSLAALFIAIGLLARKVRK